MLAVLVAIWLVPMAGDCSLDARNAGLCSTEVKNSGSAIEITGRQPTFGDDGHRESTDRSTETVDDGLTCDNPLGRCGEYEVVMRPDVTLTDIASFAPAVSPLIPEPSGVGVVGMPVNVVASATTQSVDGEIFDLPVTVRFRPVSFVFDYGDGASRETPHGGRTWSALGLAQFAPTDTSHVYSQRGTYHARVTVNFAAEVDFGTGWSPVPGVLAVPGGTTTIRVFEARTALVERHCLEDPSGVGC